MPQYKLTYFDARGRGEPARLIMHYGGIDFEDCRIAPEEWGELKPRTPFGGLPLLQFDGVTLCQATAIYRFLARKVGLNGRNEVEGARIDMIVGCFEDVMKPLSQFFKETDEAKKAQMKTEIQGGMEETLKRFEKLMDVHFCVGNQLTWADIMVVEGLDFFTAMGFDLPMNNLSKVAALVERVRLHPKLVKHYETRPPAKF